MDILKTQISVAYNVNIATHRRTFQNLYGKLEQASTSGKRQFLTGIIRHAYDRLNTPAQLIYRKAALDVAKRIDNGEDGTANNSYHNSLHFSKVASGFIQLVTLHNVQANPFQKISIDGIERGLLAAVAHDVFHDGTGNTVNGKHTQFRLEQKSIEGARGWIKPKEKNRKAIDRALSLIYATDVSGNPSPASIVREWHDHYFDGKARPEIDKVPEQMKPIILNRESTLIAAYLQDADVASSVSGLKQHYRENKRVADEANRPVTPDGSRFFTDNILHKRMTTKLARTLFGHFIIERSNTYNRQIAQDRGSVLPPAP